MLDFLLSNGKDQTFTVIPRRVMQVY